MIDRLASAAFGAVWGALIGAILVWLHGVYSQTLGPATTDIDAQRWIAGSALFFAALGLVFNLGIGSIIGSALNALLRFETFEDQSTVSGLLKGAVLVLVVLCLLWALHV